MAANYSLCLGTAGWGVWHSPDAGNSWTRHRAPFPINSRIQALVAHPTQAHTVLAGGDTGLFVSHNGGARWERITAKWGQWNQCDCANDLVADHRPVMSPANTKWSYEELTHSDRKMPMPITGKELPRQTLIRYAIPHKG